MFAYLRGTRIQSCDVQQPHVWNRMPRGAGEPLHARNRQLWRATMSRPQPARVPEGRLADAVCLGDEWQRDAAGIRKGPGPFRDRALAVGRAEPSRYVRSEAWRAGGFSRAVLDDFHAHER